MCVRVCVVVCCLPCYLHSLRHGAEACVCAAYYAIMQRASSCLGVFEEQFRIRLLLVRRVVVAATAAATEGAVAPLRCCRQSPVAPGRSRSPCVCNFKYYVTTRADNLIYERVGVGRAGVGWPRLGAGLAGLVGAPNLLRNSVRWLLWRACWYWFGNRLLRAER